MHIRVPSVDLLSRYTLPGCLQLNCDVLFTIPLYYYHPPSRLDQLAILGIFHVEFCNKIRPSQVGTSSSSSLISSLLHSHVTLNPEWCDKTKLSNLVAKGRIWPVAKANLRSEKHRICLSVRVGGFSADHAYMGTSLIRNCPPPRTSIRP